ncbi:MAG: hypothetical protein FWD76_06005, partial [Firmicutes bacterium]|nr:hypothetical protein [Bacillota bacterium]
MMKAKNLFCRFALLVLLGAGLATSFLTPMIANNASGGLGRQGRFVASMYARDLQIGDYIDSMARFNGRDQAFRVIAKDEQGVMLRSEYVVTKSKTDGDAWTDLAYSNTGVTNEVPGGDQRILINEWAVQRTSPDATGTDTWSRAENGSNYWEQSNIRAWMEDAYQKENFNNPGTNNAYVDEPLVRQPLAWMDVSWRVTGETAFVGNGSTPKVIMSDLPTPTRADIAVYGRKKTGEWIGTAETTEGFKSSFGHTTKPTRFPAKDENGVSINWVYTDVRNNPKQKIDMIYQNNPYYEPLDRLFLAPMDIMMRDEVQALKNRNGGPITQALDVNKNAVESFSSLPAPYVSVGTYARAGSHIVNFDATGNIVLRASGATDIPTGIMPCMYIKNDAIVTWNKNDPQIQGETKQYKRYGLNGLAPTAPVFGTAEDLTAQVGESFDYVPILNTTDGDLSLVSGALPDGVSIDNGINPRAIPRLVGTPTKNGVYNFVLKMVNNFGSDTSEEYRVTVEKGAPVTPPSLPALTAKVNQTVGDIKGQVTDSKWTILEDDGLVFDQTGETQISALYNPDPTEYNDNNLSLTVRVSAGQQAAPGDPPTLLDGQVGRSTQDIVIPDNDNGFFSILDDITFDKVGDAEVTLAYNEDPANFSDWTTKVRVTVAKGAPKTPTEEQIAVVRDLDLRSSWGQTAEVVSGRLPLSWDFIAVTDPFLELSPTDAEGELVPLEIPALFNDDRANYLDNTSVTIPVKVSKGQQSAPTVVFPDINASLGQRLAEIADQLPSQEFVFENPNFVLEQSGEVQVSVLYNT